MPTALIIGASRGIGLEFVRQYQAGGWRVLATARDDAGAQRLSALGATALYLDVTSGASITAFMPAIVDERLDLALYVAGITSRGGAGTAPTEKQFDRVMHTNVLGAMLLIPMVAPRVAAANGKFVFISSGMGSIGDASSSYGWLYRVSKAALNMAVRAAAFDYPGAIMTLMNPGWVKTDMGGPGATLAVGDSVSAMREMIGKLTAKDSGTMVGYDERRWPW
jgi:NAD(P)-dependent dehydrogenase (short-subunit alcohol dehydrogenase family)